VLTDSTYTGFFALDFSALSFLNMVIYVKHSCEVAADQGSRPTWNQTFTFNIEDGATELSVKLYNKNALYDSRIGDTRYGTGHTFTFSAPNSLYLLRIILNHLHFSSI
jgi:hypothetical protein